MHLVPTATTLSAVLVLGIARGAPPPEEASPPKLRAGVAEVDITPDRPLRLAGHRGRLAVASGVDGKLSARAVVLSDATGVLTVLLSVDTIGIPGWLRQRVAGAIRWRLGVYRARLALSATGTHSAPFLEGVLEHTRELTPEETSDMERYGQELAEKLVTAIDAAIRDLAPATVSYGSGLVDLAGADREDEVHVVRIGRPGGALRAVLFGCSWKASSLPPELNRVDADWPGYATAALAERDPAVAWVPLPECDADSLPTHGGKRSAARAMGRAVAEEVSGILSRPLDPIEGRVDARIRYVDVPRPTGKEREAAARVPVQVFCLSDVLVLAFVPGEAGSETARVLESSLYPKATWVLSRSNDFSTDNFSRAPRVHAEKAIRDAVVELVRGSGGSLLERLKPPPPVAPPDAIRTLRFPEDLAVELAAAEPEVTDPVAVAFDAECRLFVAEMRDYPLGPKEGAPPDSRIRLLEDRDGDGYFEASAIFAREVPFANGVACWDGGVFVTALDAILYLRDTDGDNHADERRVVYTGLATGNSQHLANAPCWSLENWIYVNGGDSARVQAPGVEHFSEVRFSRSSFRFHPRTLDLELVTGYRGGFVLAFDDFGERFVVDNQNHALHVVHERRYLGRNPFLRVGETVNNITDHGRVVYPASRPLERFNDPFDEGRFTAACGVHVYRSSLLPERYRGSLFSCDNVGNLVHRDVLEPSGASYIARRGEERREFLSSTDHWFRPVSCATGPDGALYIVDMYREVIEHPEWIPAHIQELFDLKNGMERGRIWRIVPAKGGAPRPGAVRSLGSRSSAELARTLSSPSVWHRDTAQRLLVEARDRSVVPRLEETLREAPSWRGRLGALWTLHGLEALEPRHVLVALRDAHSALRCHGARLAEDFLETAEAATREALSGALKRLSRDGDARVRFQAALSLGFLPAEERLAPLTAIALRDLSDPWTSTAVLTSLEGSPLPLLEALLGGVQVAGDPPRERWPLIVRLAELAGRRGEAPEVVGCLSALIGSARATALRTQAVTALLRPLRARAVAEVLDAATDDSADGGGSPSRLVRFFENAAERAADEGASLEERVGAVELLGHASNERTLELLGGLLDPRHSPAIQIAAVRSLTRRGDDASDERLLEAFGQLVPKLRREAIDSFLRDEGGITRLLDEIEAETVLPNEIDLDQRARLLQAPTPALRRRAREVLASVAVDPDRSAVIDAFRDTLAARADDGAEVPRGDPRRGRELFLEHCAICHRLEDEGEAVGPELSAMRDRSADALLVDILDPSRAVIPAFASYTVVTTDGRIVSGVLASNLPGGIELRQSEGKIEYILRRDVLRLEAGATSVMPEGLEQELDAGKLADVIAFLKGRPVVFH